jgi:hypothetical protein
MCIRKEIERGRQSAIESRSIHKAPAAGWRWGFLYMFQAYKWFSLARETNSNLPVVAECMTIQQIFEAERLVAEWKYQHPIP